MAFLEDFAGRFGFYRKDLKCPSDLKIVSDKLSAANVLLAQLQDTEDGKTKTITDQNAKITEQDAKLILFSEEVISLEKEIEGLRAKLSLYEEPETRVPDFLDESKPAYRPTMQYLDEKGKLNSVQITTPQDIYPLWGFALNIVIANQWNKLSEYKALMAMWNFVVLKKNLEYISDYGDNWAPAVLTYYRKKGDCEDGVLLFMALIRAYCALVPNSNLSARAFNAVGDCSFGYHSFPIIEITEENCVEAGVSSDKAGFCIFETTLDYEQTSPAILKGSKSYFIDEGGLQNWKFSGQIKSSYSDMFNLSISSKAPGASIKQLDKSKDKHKRIRDNWKNGVEKL
ncbi:MAG: hypothetical protein WC451_02595 [Patescibacteria group bacterium]